MDDKVIVKPMKQKKSIVISILSFYLAYMVVYIFLYTFKFNDCLADSGST